NVLSNTAFVRVCTYNRRPIVPAVRLLPPVPCTAIRTLLLLMMLLACFAMLLCARRRLRGTCRIFSTSIAGKTPRWAQLQALVQVSNRRGDHGTLQSNRTLVQCGARSRAVGRAGGPGGGATPAWRGIAGGHCRRPA